jgi:transposase-like protein
VCALTEDEAYEWFKKARWPSTAGEPVCPKCGCIGANKRRKRAFRCKAIQCLAEFSVTSGTILASHKLSFKKMLEIIAHSVLAVKGIAPLLLKRVVGIGYKSAFVLLHKLREAIAILRKEIRLDGIVEMDGMYVGGHVRPANEKEKRVDTRLAENKSGKRRAVITMRERDLKTGRTLSAAAPEERRDIAWHLVKHHVAREAIVCADDHKAYDELRGLNGKRCFAAPLQRHG